MDNILSLELKNSQRQVMSQKQKKRRLLYLLLHGEKILSSISSAISHATRASGDCGPNFLDASNAA